MKAAAALLTAAPRSPDRLPPARMFVWLPLKIVKLEFAFTFPPANRLIAREGTVILAALMRIPLRRGVHFKGEMIRYA